MEGDTCLRSADCSEGLCCARHFWSRICKPVLTEGQVCTRHRRKGTHGLELFQRCDCGEGMTCRPERGERDHSVSRTAARNLHTCQRRWHRQRQNAHTTQDTHKHTRLTKQTGHKHFSAFHTPEMLTHTRRHPTPNTFFPARVADAAPGRMRRDSWKTDTPRGMHRYNMDWSILPSNRWEAGSLGRVDWCCQHWKAELFCFFLWNFKPRLLQ